MQARYILCTYKNILFQNPGFRYPYSITSSLVYYIVSRLSPSFSFFAVNWLFFEFRVTIQVERTPKLLFLSISQKKTKNLGRNGIQYRVGQLECRNRKKKIMMISKRNDEGHKSKTLIWTQREQKPYRHSILLYSYKICMWYVPCIHTATFIRQDFLY